MARDHSQPLTEITFSPEREKAGQRLDTLLHQKFPHRSRSYFQKIIKKGDVLLNGKKARASQHVNYQDVVSIKVEENKTWVDPNSIPLDVIHECDDLVAVNKAPHQIVHPTGETQGGTVINALHARHKNKGGDDTTLPKVLHRLDQETSGVLVFAKGKNAGYYGQLFEQRKTTKTYVALLEGTFNKSFTSHELIGNDTSHVVHMAQGVVPDGKHATSHFEPLICINGLTFCKIRIETGRLHQIRVHAAYAGFPVFGDSLYNPQDEDMLRWTEGREPQHKEGRPTRQLLHAHELKFSRVDGEILCLRADLPDDFVTWGGATLNAYWKNKEF